MVEKVKILVKDKVFILFLKQDEEKIDCLFQSYSLHFPINRDKL